MCVSKASSATPRGSQCRLNNPPRPCLWKNGKLSSARLVTGAKKFGDHCKGYCSIHQTTDTRLLSGQKKKKKMSKMSLALLAQQGLGGSKAMAPHSSTLAWKIPWTREPGRLQSMRSRRVGHDWGTSLSLFTFMHWRRKWQPTPVFLPGESQGQGAWWAAVYGVVQSRTQLKRLSSSSSSSSKFHSVWQRDMCLRNCACVNVFKISTVQLFPKKDTIVRDIFVITLYT